MVSVTPIQGKPALLIKGKRSVLCIADLHIGYEMELRESGFNVPDQSGAMLAALVGMDEGDQLFILGDLKHSIPITKEGESVRLRRFLRSLAERYSEVTLIAGNHDGAIERFLPENVRFIPSGGTSVHSIGLAHGHSWPSAVVMRARTLVWGHLHPCVRLHDRLGASITMKCWLRGPTHPDTLVRRYEGVQTRESIVMPSFNPLLTGTSVNENIRNRLSPLTRSGFLLLEEQHGYTMDGVDLGEISRLTKKQPGR